MDVNFESKQLELINLNVNDKTETKNNLTYLSWAFAWSEFIKVFPDATYKVVTSDSGLCYFGDESIGYMVHTEVTAGEVTRSMWLPVMDGANKAMKNQSYTYKVKDWTESKKQKKDVYKEKTVEAISMFDVNKAVMRCLTKNLAMFGLGIYIYAGEDLPESVPTGIDCTDLIEEASSKGIKAIDVEKKSISLFKHGLEFISNKEHDKLLDLLKKAEVKVDES